jgi:hypothetical protein
MIITVEAGVIMIAARARLPRSLSGGSQHGFTAGPARGLSRSESALARARRTQAGKPYFDIIESH